MLAPIDPAVLRRIYGVPDWTACTDCAELGHLCRPCRKTRYERRDNPLAGWAWVIAVWAALAVVLL